MELTVGWVIFVISCLLVTSVMTMLARYLFECCLKRETIIKFASKSDDYDGYFTFIFLILYIPGLNVMSIIAFLAMLEVDNLKRLRIDGYE